MAVCKSPGTPMPPAPADTNLNQCGRGKNGDIWKLIYAQLKLKRFRPAMVKVRSRLFVAQ